MNATLRFVAVLALCTASVAAVEPQVRVAASRELRVAVIDATKASATRDAMHVAFATSLGESLTKQCGGPVGVKTKCVGVDHAAFNLGTGVYDAVLVVGKGVPDRLRRVDAITLSALPENGKRDRMLYLLIAGGDDTLQGLLAAAFTGALRDGKFLETFANSDGKIVTPAGEKIAAQE